MPDVGEDLCCCTPTWGKADGLPRPVDRVGDLADEKALVVTERGSLRRAIRPTSLANAAAGPAPAVANRPDAVEGREAPDRGRNARAADASAAAGSLHSSMTERRRD